MVLHQALLLLLFLPAFAYQALSLFACLRFWLRKEDQSSFAPPLSILKPIRGLDADMFATFISQAQQNYPEFEILFGVADADDPAIPLIQKLQHQFPHLAIALHIGSEKAGNRKTGVLMNLAKHARHPYWIINDSDIRVTPSYLREVIAPLEDPANGVVTCLYRPSFQGVPTGWEAFGIAVDFMPSTLVAPLAGVREFGLGSTLCFRAAEFEAVGGFAGIADYIADDYHLAQRIVRSGKRAHLSRYIVETSLGDSTWTGIWQHQLRWARTIRSSNGAGFAGLPIAHTGVWIVCALLAHLWPVAFILFFMRVATAVAAGWLVLRIRRNLLLAAAAPLWDIFAFCVWVTSYRSREVRWRDRHLRITPDGRLRPL